MDRIQTDASCTERKEEDARYYSELMTSWHAIVAASMEYIKDKPEQLELF